MKRLYKTMSSGVTAVGARFREALDDVFDTDDMFDSSAEQGYSTGNETGIANKVNNGDLFD